MRGYPKNVATRADYVNLLQVDLYRPQALAELRAIVALDDDTALRSLGIAENGTETTEVIANPMPLWAVKGFSSRGDAADLIAQYEEEVQP